MEVLGSRFVVAQAVDKLNLVVDASPRYLPVVGRLIANYNDKLSTPAPGGFVWGKEHIDVSRFDVPSQLYDRPFTLRKSDAGSYELAYRDIRLRGTVGESMHATTPYGPIDVRVDGIDANLGAEFNVTRFSSVAAIESVRKSLSITDKGKESDVIKASYDGTDPVKTAAVLNAVASAYVQQDIQRRSEEAGRSINFLEVQLPELKRQVEAAEVKFNAYRALHGTVNLSEEATNLLRRSAEAQRRRVELEEKRKDLLALYTSEHPSVRSIDSQLQVAQGDVDRIAEQAKKLPPLEQDVLRLQRDVQVNNEIYTALLNTYEQLRVVKAGKLGNARLVDTAVIPEQLFWPKRTFIMCVSLLFGLFCGIAAALTRRQLFDAVNDPYEIEDTIGLQVYANVPYSAREARRAPRLRSPRSQSTILANSSNLDPAIESLRGFRTVLEYALLDARNRIVLITGPTSGVGKSFITLNLAAILGESGKRVLLVDADLHRGHLHQHIGGERDPGLSDLIRGTCGLDGAIRSNALPGVDFIPTGTSSPNATDLLASRKADATLARLADEYDVVLLDAAPLISTDAALHLANLAGTTFLVVRQGVTGMGELREATRKLERIGLAVRGVVVNGLRLRPGHRSYGYGRYRYAADSYELNFNRKR
ncbi:GNVR domain-containing protein [Paraburkholderia fungorum]|uniref:GNVR domain-containing protein n=1 Tax=Paraburkholderia fungorum TaxID=134537 RepID=UPI0038BDEC1A